MCAERQTTSLNGSGTSARKAETKRKIIAIDGPAGSGKSTTARLLAARLGYSYLDTGAMYRALTWLALKWKVQPADAVQLTKLAHEVTIRFKTEANTNRVFINDEEVTAAIRTPEVTKYVSEVSAHRGVRESMVAMQKELGKVGGIVAEGRDTTTAVFPQADLKVYLDASVETRARRRLGDLAGLGIESSLEEQMADIRRRDALDSGREVSPLRKAADAHQVDTTHLTIEEQVDKIVALLASTAAKP